MQSISEYAKSIGKTSQAIYKVLPRYEKELDGHIIEGINHLKQKTRYLDDYAIKFLNDKYNNKPVTQPLQGTQRVNKDTIYSYQEQINELQAKIIQLQEQARADLLHKDELLEQKDKYIQQLTDKIYAIESKPQEQTQTNESTSSNNKPNFFQRLFSINK